jgi:hypothetical protein
MALMWIGVRTAGSAVGLVAAAQHVATLALGLFGGVARELVEVRPKMAVAEIAAGPRRALMTTST